ncbi:hypothetical protein, partial [Pararhizobium sp. PWRC1-1]|uniref:hypothetical protein n=1 Tax=Pararhizobium sp. PWRC1-1 TaxID=2804566 RepID=UPI003CF99D2F
MTASGQQATTAGVPFAPFPDLTVRGVGGQGAAVPNILLSLVGKGGLAVAIDGPPSYSGNPNMRAPSVSLSATARAMPTSKNK